MNPFDEMPEERNANGEPAAEPVELTLPTGEEAEATPAPEEESSEEELVIPEPMLADPAFADADESDSESLVPAEVPPAGVENGIESAAQAEVDSAGDATGAPEAGEEPAEGEAPAAPGPDPNKIPGQDENPLMNWFIVHTYSGFENKVSESLRTRADAFGFAHRLGQILIPTEEVVEMRNGKKVTSKRLLYPGYVLVQMEMDDDLWHQVKNTPRVTGFVGGGGQPVPLTATEVNSILYRQTEAAERPRPKLSYEKNETVRIIDGPFANFQGKVDEINTERNTLRVMVTIFGRSTPVELDFLQVEKMA
jgi:transcriptional antiterminator NusG